MLTGVTVGALVDADVWQVLQVAVSPGCADALDAATAKRATAARNITAKRTDFPALKFDNLHVMCRTSMDSLAIAETYLTAGVFLAQFWPAMMAAVM